MYTHIFELSNFPVSAKKYDVVKTQICLLCLLISMGKENLYAEMEKLEAQICRCTRQAVPVVIYLMKQGARSH